jgi:hypothetical protein
VFPTRPSKKNVALPFFNAKDVDVFDVKIIGSER